MNSACKGKIFFSCSGTAVLCTTHPHQLLNLSPLLFLGGWSKLLCLCGMACCWPGSLKQTVDLGW